MSPIPPSLVSSPFLHAAVFNTDNSANHQPTEQDELWLQDTVPIAFSSNGSSGSLRPQLKHISYNKSSHPAPYSPPIVVHHHPGAPHPPRVPSFSHPSHFHSPLPSPSLNHPLSNSHPGLHQPPPNLPSIVRSRPSSWGSHITHRPGSDLAPSPKKDRKPEGSA